MCIAAALHASACVQFEEQVIAMLGQVLQRFDAQEETRKQEAKKALEQAWELAKARAHPPPPRDMTRSQTKSEGAAAQGTRSIPRSQSGQPS